MTRAPNGDFYTPAQKESEQRSFARFLTAGIALILVVLVVMMGFVGAGA